MRGTNPGSRYQPRHPPCFGLGCLATARMFRAQLNRTTCHKALLKITLEGATSGLQSWLKTARWELRTAPLAVL